MSYTSTISSSRVPVPAREDVVDKDEQNTSPPRPKSRPNSGSTISSLRVPVPALEDVVEKDERYSTSPKPRSRPDSTTAPSSPILSTHLSSARHSTVRFSSSVSNSESLPSLRSDSSSGTPSPNTGPSRPPMPNRSSSRPGESYTSSVQYKRPVSTGSSLFARKAWPSTKLKGEIEKPWRKYPDPAHRWGKIIFWTLVGLGFAVGALVVYLGIRSVPSPGKLCLVMDDNFSQGLDQFWTREVRLDGYGNNQFEWTSASDNNSYISDETLYLVPTLTSDHLGVDAITNGYTLNLTTDGTCTSANVTQCGAVSNSSLGTMINPVMSSRLTTKGKASIKYGKVEVTARMPTGDWLWPAIWMMPTDDVYGTWPKSGEIDIIESRGNNYTYGKQGNDHVQSALHWGPVAKLDSYLKTWGVRSNRAQNFADVYHKYTLEWTDKYLTTYVDNKVQGIMEFKFDESFWKRGNYPTYYQNGSVAEQVTNPWYSSTNNAAPFDQDFYLILDVAVGGTNGFFPDNLGSKPWLDSSPSAMNDFWKAKERWYPSWPSDHTKRGMAVKSVKMWQKC